MMKKPSAALITEGLAEKHAELSIAKAAAEDSHEKAQDSDDTFHSKRGGSHWDLQQAKSGFKSAEEAAMQAVSKEAIKNASFLTQFVIAVNWKDSWLIRYSSKLDERVFEKALLERLAIEPHQLDIKRRNFLVNFSYTFPLDDDYDFFRRICEDRWKDALDALGDERDVCAWNDFQGKRMSSSPKEGSM